jgi:hypothetical protein
MAKKVNLGTVMLSPVHSYDTPAGHSASKDSGKHSKHAHKLHKIHTEITDNGGFSVQTFHRDQHGNETHMPSGHHVFEDRNSHDEFMDHTLGTPDHSGKGKGK